MSLVTKHGTGMASFIEKTVLLSNIQMDLKFGTSMELNNKMQTYLLIGSKKVFE